MYSLSLTATASSLLAREVVKRKFCSLVWKTYNEEIEEMKNFVFSRFTQLVAFPFPAPHSAHPHRTTKPSDIIYFVLLLLLPSLYYFSARTEPMLFTKRSLVTGQVEFSFIAFEILIRCPFRLLSCFPPDQLMAIVFGIILIWVELRSLESDKVSSPNGLKCVSLLIIVVLLFDDSFGADWLRSSFMRLTSSWNWEENSFRWNVFINESWLKLSRFISCLLH